MDFTHYSKEWRQRVIDTNLFDLHPIRPLSGLSWQMKNSWLLKGTAIRFMDWQNRWYRNGHQISIEKVIEISPPEIQEALLFNLELFL